MKKHNFNAGPSILPEKVIQKASESILNYNNSDLSLLEISHRSEFFVAIIEKARSLALELLGLENKGYKALFLQGGASLEFLMIPYNLLNKSADYLNTGFWSEKAIKEAKIFGEITEISSSKENKYTSIPKKYNISKDADYFHCTSNNTITGTQIKEFPDIKIPLVCDMSSDIFSRQLEFEKFSLIYAGSQKNIGPAGTTLVVIKEDILGKIDRKIPAMLNYQTHIDKESMHNTPSVFAVYASMLTLQWLKDLGGIKFIEKVNSKKAKLLYSEIDRNPLFKGIVRKEDRSIMNATFNLTDSKLKENFDNLCKEASIYGINGHRSFGGYRASMYNSLPLYSVQALVDVMQELERKV